MSTSSASETDSVQTAHEPQASAQQVQVSLVRSVRFGRIIIVATVIGAVVGALLSLSFPVGEDAEYTLAQIVGFIAVLGAAIGLGVGALFALILALAVRRRRGTGTAIQADVR